MDQPSHENSFQQQHAELLVVSYQRLTGKQLIESSANVAQSLYEAPFCIVSHNTEADPVFNYGNSTAQRLFELSWSEFTQLPSRCSAEPVNREERQRLLIRVSRDGYIDDYRGVRISSTGQRFWIEQATVWNLLDERGEYRGQAAMFQHWTPLDA